MANANENVVQTLRQETREQLLEKRRRIVRGLKFNKWLVIVLGAGAVVETLLTHDYEGVAVALALAAIFSTGIISERTKVWFIDLVLAEKPPTP